MKIIRLIIPFLTAGIILMVINFIFFAEQFKGNVLQQGDMVNATAMVKEAKDHYDKTGNQTYWTNSMFGGMPTYQIYNPGGKSSLFDYMVRLFGFFTSESLYYFMIMSLATFLALCFLGVGPWLALFGAIATSFASNHIGLVSAGHLTKIATLGFVPLIIVGSYLIFNKKRLGGFLCYTFGLAASISMNHIQMTYYTGLILAFYIVAEIYKHIKEKRVKDLLTSGGYLVAGTLVAVLVNLSLLLSLNDYAKDTMRGGSILTVQAAQEADINTASGKNGLGWEYAMQWSNGTSDLLSMLAPGAAGGSSNEEWSGNSTIAQELKRNRMQIPQDFRLPLYWGKLPFTSGPDYLGILIVMLFFIGLFIVKGPFKWFALFTAIFLILQSMGKNFEVLNRLLFDYLPYYNKFRTPNSILNVLSSVVPLFAMFSLYHFMQISWKADALKKLYTYAVAPLAGILLLLILIGPNLFDLTSPQNDASWQANRQMYDLLLDARASYMRKDALRSLLFLALGSGFLYYFALGKIKKQQLLLGIGLLITIDLYSVAKRYLDGGDFEQKKSVEANLTPRPADQEILKDNDLHYRVFDLSISSFNSAMPSYFHKNIGGYHPAKLRRYQDMIDYYFSKVNRTALNMMNTKYIIDQNGAPQGNPDAYGNAWFVSGVKTVNSPDEEIAAAATGNPSEEAVVLVNDFPGYSLPGTFQKNGSIVLTSYAPDKLTYQSNSSSDQLALFSEVWYGPGKGWHATIDGKAADHIRSNYILRAMKVPAGEHTIEFSFKPDSILTLKNISYFSGMLLGLAILVFIFMDLKRRQSLPDTPVTVIQPASPVSKKQVPETQKTRKKK